MKKLITRSIGVTLLIVVFASCVKINSYLSGFGLSKNHNSSNVESFPLYFKQMQSWAKENKFSLTSTKVVKNKEIILFNGSFRSLRTVSLEFSTSTEKGKEFIMCKANFLTRILKTKKTTTDMDYFQNQIKKIIFKTKE